MSLQLQQGPAVNNVTFPSFVATISFFTVVLGKRTAAGEGSVTVSADVKTFFLE